MDMGGKEMTEGMEGGGMGKDAYRPRKNQAKKPSLSASLMSALSALMPDLSLAQWVLVAVVTVSAATLYTRTTSQGTVLYSYEYIGCKSFHSLLSGI